VKREGREGERKKGREKEGRVREWRVKTCCPMSNKLSPPMVQTDWKITHMFNLCSLLTITGMNTPRLYLKDYQQMTMDFFQG